MRRALALLLCCLAPGALAGSFIFASEGSGTSIVTHPKGYTGTGTVATVTVCVHPSSPNAGSMSIPVQNAVNTWNRMRRDSPNLVFGASNDIPPSGVDFESVLLHEMGHCIGLAHPNLGSQPGVAGDNTNYTASTDGAAAFAFDDGADNVIGSRDDVRGDDVNLHWSRVSNNNPFTMESSVFDATTYSRDVADLPGGHLFAENADRTVGSTLRGVSNTEAVMQQGQFTDEAQRRLMTDDVATIWLAESGVDETQGTSDDYTFVLDYIGMASSCDIVVSFERDSNSNGTIDGGEEHTSFGVCEISGTTINSTHWRITGANTWYDAASTWHFSTDDNDDDDDGCLDDEDGTPLVAGLDVDGDGISADCDNCPLLSNKRQLDPDADGDGTGCDNCPSTANATQADTDLDGVGDACDACAGTSVGCTVDATGCAPDADGDGACNAVDLCPGTTAGCSVNATGCTSDSDSDGVCNGLDACASTAPGCTVNAVGCPTDSDGDGTCNQLDNCPSTANADQANSDADSRGNACDNCPAVTNESQADTDGDGIGDACEAGGCTLGDVHPDGVGDGDVDLADFVLARRKVLGSVATVPRDDQCGDIHPGAVTCVRAGADAWCVTGDDNLALGDVVIIRRLVLDTYDLDCASCRVAERALSGAEARLPGDLAPAGGGDARVDVADAVAALRASVGLARLDAEETLRSDVAPAERADGLAIIRGDARVDVADVVLLLRASVGLERLAWPVRSLELRTDRPVELAAFAARMTGWPAWSSPAGIALGACGAGEEIDADAATWGAACVPDVLAEHELLGVIRYRAPEPVAASDVRVALDLVGDSLEPVAATPVLVMP